MSSEQSFSLIAEYKWLDSYSVGNAVIDQQHQKMLMLCVESAKCLDTVGCGSNERFHELLHEMSVCAREHFAAEEELLLARNYPRLAEHLAEHEQYRIRLTDFLCAATLGQLDRVEVFRFLSDWWGSHVLESDMDYRLYLADR